MQKIKHGQRCDKHEPTLEFMKEALCFIRIPVLDQQARDHDAQAVGSHGDGK
jgi:hypothetical protein